MTEVINNARPRFLSSFLGEMKEDFEARGLQAVLPLWFSGFIAFGECLSCAMSSALWKSENWGTAATFYGAILTLDAILLAFSWGAFSRIQETICAPGFSVYLRSKGLTQGYIFYIDFIHYAQIAAASVAMLALVLYFVSDIPLIWERIALGASLGLSAYAIKQAMGAVQMMHDIVWYHSIYEQHQDQLGSNVSAFPGRT